MHQSLEALARGRGRSPLPLDKGCWIPSPAHAKLGRNVLLGGSAASAASEDPDAAQATWGVDRAWGFRAVGDRTVELPESILTYSEFFNSSRRYVALTLKV